MIPAERLQQARRRLDIAQAELASLERQHADARRAADDLQARVLASDVALRIVKMLRDVATARVQQRLTELATEGLRVVFDDPGVSLRVEFVERRGVVEADLRLVRGAVSTDPLEGNGGGLVADVAAMLRLVMVRMLTARGIAPLLILDEPFAALSAGHRAAMADTLEEVAGQLGIQVICVTHAPDMVRGRVYRARWADRAALRAEFVEEVVGA